MAVPIACIELRLDHCSLRLESSGLYYIRVALIMGLVSLDLVDLELLFTRLDRRYRYGDSVSVQYTVKMRHALRCVAFYQDLKITVVRTHLEFLNKSTTMS